ELADDVRGEVVLGAERAVRLVVVAVAAIARTDGETRLTGRQVERLALQGRLDHVLIEPRGRGLIRIEVLDAVRRDLRQRARPPLPGALAVHLAERADAARAGAVRADVVRTVVRRQHQLLVA